jgi:hypothetical protein
MPRGLSQKVAAAEAEILRIAKTIAPSAKTVNFPMREFYSCTIVVATDAEKRRINDDPALLLEMTERAAAVGRKPDYLSAESQETVDRRYNGDWNYVWR